MSIKRKVLGSGLALTVAAGAGGGYIWHEDRLPGASWIAADGLPSENKLAKESIICDNNEADCAAATALGTVSTAAHVEVKTREIAPFALKAAVDSEDKTFYQHDGFSGRGFERALLKNLWSGTKYTIVESFKDRRPTFSPSTFLSQGGSTIEGQTARYLYFKPKQNLTSTEKINQQALETRYALRMDQVYTKQQILEKYLNTAPFGRNTIGIEAASWAHYNIPAKELSDYQAILLISQLTGPSNKDVSINSPNSASSLPYVKGDMQRLKLRYDRIVETMRGAGDISETTAKTLTDKMNSNFVYDNRGTLVRVHVPFIDFRPTSGTNYLNATKLGARHFISAAYHEIDSLHAADPTNMPLTSDMIKHGGYKVITTMNKDDQKQLMSALTGNRAVNSNPDLAAIGVSLAEDGSVMAIGQSETKGKNSLTLALGKAAGGSGWDTGSSNKPYALALALEKGWTLKKTDKGKKIKIAHKTLDVPKENGTQWKVNVSEDCAHLGAGEVPCEATPEDALIHSLNSLPLQIVKEFGVVALTKKLQALGLEKTTANDPSVALGSGAFSPFTQAGGYDGLILNKGKSVDKHFVTKILTTSNKVVYEYKAPEAVRVFDSEAARLTIKAMQGVIREGTARGTMQPPNGPLSVAGKTGTGNNRSTLWFNGGACDTKKGGRAASFLVTNPSGNTRIESLERSGQVAKMWGNYIKKTLTTGQPCDVVTFQNHQGTDD